MQRSFHLLLSLIVCSVAAVGSSQSFQEGSVFQSMQTDKARYSPGDTVTITLSLKLPSGSTSFLVRYFSLDSLLEEHALVTSSGGNVVWKWLPPQQDYHGYLVQALCSNGSDTCDLATIGVDVSPAYGKFIRYGFVSKYSLIFPSAIESLVARLNRYHINGVQFYDWHYKHHMPLKGTPENPASQWKDIANRDNYFVTVKGYIDAMHARGMKTMAYNLLYGAYADADNDGADINSWGLYRDAGHQQRYMYDLPSNWASDLYFMDPSNQDWKNYICAQEAKVFQALPFDGWHVDQVGDPGNVYNYKGARIDLAGSFQSFLENVKNELHVPLAMNAVNQYGQQGIAKAPVDFLYTEVWDVAKTYAGLKSLVEQNWSYSDGVFNTVFAAYMNYGLSNKAGSTFNTPGVLLTDAVMFASGGSHLELGEHMLVHEYFPNENASMSQELENKLIRYYDFLVGYENVLRDGVSPVSVSITSTGPTPFSQTEAVGAVWYFGREKNNALIIHCINLTHAAHLLWRDDNGTQTVPETLSLLPISIAVEKKVKKVWIASPDYLGGTPVELQFVQAQSGVSCTIPTLAYWDVLVIEFDEGATPVDKSEKELDHSDVPPLEIYPSPFNSSATIAYALSTPGAVRLEVFNIAGKRVATLVNKIENAGRKTISWTPDASSGVYFLRLSLLPDRQREQVLCARKFVYLK